MALTQPRRRGRPTKLTPEMAAEVEKALLGRMPREQAAAKAGIDKATMYRWLQRAKRRAGRDTIHARFLNTVEMAECQAVFEALQQIRAAGDEWGAAGWWLERAYSSEFGHWRRPTPEAEPVPEVQIVRIRTTPEERRSS